MVHCPMSGFWPHLSSIIRVRQAVEGQELGLFAQVMRDSGDTTRPTTTLETGSKAGSLDGPSWRHKSRIISVLF